MADDHTATLIDELYKLANARLSDGVLHQAKRCMLDYLGAAFAGVVLLQGKGQRFIENSRSNGTATVIGHRAKSDILTAALVDGISAHVAEMDDGERRAAVHAGATVISALLPLVETEGLSGLDMLRGIVVGYEAAIRVGRAIQPSHRGRGFHATGTCGTVGAAMGAAAALRLTREEMRDAFSAAATSASGLLKVMEDTSELKPYNAGRAALSGLVAMQIARAGFRGLDDVLGGMRGFLTVMANPYSISPLSATPSSPLAIECIYVKPYAACRHCHPAIEAALDIRNSEDVLPSDIDSIQILTYAMAADGHTDTCPRSITSAKMSTPFSVAVAFHTGRAGIEEFLPPRFNDSEIQSLASKVKVISDSDLTSLVPTRRAAIVQVRTRSGKSHCRRVDFPRGEPERPLSDREIEDKFRYLANFGRASETTIDSLVNTVWNLEKDIDDLFRLLS